MSDLDIHSDPLLHLLTDALRAGPGTPAWHMALDRIGDAPADEATQYRKLMEARAALESGKGYRSVRAGPGFTRKVMEGIDADPHTARIPTANIVAALSILVVLVILGVSVWSIVGRSGAVVDESNTLGRLYFGTPVAVADFSQKRLPDGFRAIGELPLEFNGRFLRSAKNPTTQPGEPDLIGGGIVTEQPLTPADVFAVEVDVRTRPWVDDVLAQVFVSDTPDFSTDRATSAHELAWLIQSNRPTVALPDGRLVGSNSKLPDVRESYLVRFVLDRDNARIETAGQLVWSGKHQLSPTAPRYVGVRILQKPKGRPDSVVFNAVRVLKP